MKALTSMATRQLLSDLAMSTASSRLAPLEIESVGGVDALRRVEAGEPVDLVILADDSMRRLRSIGRIAEGTLTPLVVSHVAIAVASASPDLAHAPQSPAFPSADELRAALRSAKGIGYSTGPSGRALIDLIEKWGLLPELCARLVQARPGVPVARSLVSGEVDLAFQQASELIGEPGVHILGLMPVECSIITTFTGGVATLSANSKTATDWLDFLASPETERTKRRRGFASP